MLAPALPTVFGDFLLLQRLAASGMAEVLLAVRLGDRSGRAFVVKRPLLGERASGRAAQAITREAEVLEAVRAPGLLTLEATGTIAGLPYVATELVRGAPLRAVLRGGALPSGALRAVAKDLASALAALHEAGFVHGDVSPSNVLVDDAGEIRLIDLGLAARVGGSRAEIAGTAGYVAPEAIRTGPVVAPAEDVYGWGAIVAECALGARLFDERELTQAAARGDAPAALGELPGDLELDVRAALRRDPANRPEASSIAARLASADLDRSALAEAVAKAAEPEPEPEPAPKLLTPTAPMVVVARADAAVPPERREPSNPWRTFAIALIALVAGALGVYAGRASVRAPRLGSVAFAGTIPRTAQLELDGRPISAPVDGTPTPLAPGRHAVVVTLRGGDRREYTFSVRAGEQVLLVPLVRLAGGAVDRAEDHP